MELKRSINNNNNSKKIYYPVAMYVKSKLKKANLKKKSQKIWTLPKSPMILKVIINLLIDLSLVIWLF